MGSAESIPRQTLLEHEDFVRKLASHLMRDANDADDLAQETWLALLQRRVAASALAGLVRSLAWTSRRSSRRRAEREREAGTHGAFESAEALASRLEMQQLVVECVLDLAEPYRSVVLLRFYRDLSPIKIAETLGVPLQTVKTRLRRGLAQLREVLDRRHGGGGRAWLAALIPFVPGPAPLLTSATGAAVVKSKLVLVGALIVALSIGGLWWALAATKSELRGDATAGPARVEVPAAKASDGAALAGATRAGEPVRAELPAVPLASSGPGVLVVDRLTRAPIAGAEVWFAPWSRFIRRDRFASDPRDELPAVGQRLVTDSQGSVRLPRVEEYLFVGARHANLWGELRLSAGATEPQTIELSVDRSITILVVDAAGAARAGVPVGLRVRGERFDSVEMQAYTLADGSAVLRHIDHEIGRELLAGRWLFATLLAVTEQPVEVGIDPSAFPAEPVRLVLPKTGKVVIEVRDEQDRLWTGAASFHLTPLLPRLDDPSTLDRQQRQSIYSDSGRATFSHVALGSTLAVDVQSQGRCAVEVERAGPSRPGEELTFHLRAGRAYPSLSGRATDAAGQPLSTRTLLASVELHCGDAGEHSRQMSIHTDKDGRFQLFLEAEPDVESWGRAELRSDGATPPVLSAFVELPRTVRVGATDLGDIRFEPEPRIASGTVVDSAGAPLYWTTVDLARMTPKDEVGAPPYEWLAGCRAITAEDGSFTMHGRIPPGEYALACQKAGYVDSGFLTFQVGATELRIVLGKQGVLQGSVLVDESIPPQWLHVETAVDGVVHDYEGRAQVRPDGGFVVGGLGAGMTAVRIKLDKTSAPLVTIEDVLVEEGGTTSDPRVRGIDLRGKLRRIDIDVESASGQPVESGYVAYGPAGDAGEPRRVFIEHGRASLLTLSTSVDIDVIAVGHRSAALKQVRGSTRVRLEAGIAVRVRLPDDIPLPPDPARLRLALVDEADIASWNVAWIHSQDGVDAIHYSNWARRLTLTFDDEREVVVALPRAGSYRPNWSFMSGDARSSSQFVRSQRDQDRVQIDDDGREHLLTLAPDLAELREMLATQR